MVILQHTPHWVFGLFFALLVFGLRQTFAHRLTLRRSTLLPLALAGLSLMGVVSAFGEQPLALLAWAGGLVSALLALHGRVDLSMVRFSAPDRQFQMPGSGWPLVLMMSLFVLKYGVGVTLALHHELRHATELVLAVSTAYGVFSGVFLGRAMALWAMARQSLQLQAA